MTEQIIPAQPPSPDHPQGLPEFRLNVVPATTAEKDQDARDLVLRQFSTYALTDEQADAIERMRRVAAKMAVTIIAHAPPCIDRAVALRKLREAVWAAEAAVTIPQP